MQPTPTSPGTSPIITPGGMILRPPGSAWYGDYPASDIRAYDEIGEMGERMLPWYDYYIIWQGLYTVHGGSIDWTADGHGAVSFSNELWNGNKYFQSPLLAEQQQDDRTPIGNGLSRYFFDEFLEFGEHYPEWAALRPPRVRSGGDERDWEAHGADQPSVHEHGGLPSEHGLHPVPCRPDAPHGIGRHEGREPWRGYVQGLGRHHEPQGHSQHHGPGHESIKWSDRTF